MELPTDSPNPGQPYARKRPYESSGIEDGVIDLTQAKLKSKKLSLSKSKPSPTSKSAMHPPQATDSDDDFQGSVHSHRESHSKHKQSSISTPVQNQYRSDSEDSFSDVFPVQSIMVCLFTDVNC